MECGVIQLKMIGLMDQIVVELLGLCKVFLVIWGCDLGRCLGLLDLFWTLTLLRRLNSFEHLFLNARLALIAIFILVTQILK